MKLLELFSGTGSVGTVAIKFHLHVVSLDLKDADINCDILEWDYRQYPSGYFDFIHASPPRTEYSRAKTVGIRKIDEANKIVLKTLEIIDYFKPTVFVIENPQSGLLKKQEFMNDLDYFVLMLITVNTVLITGSALASGVILPIGNQDLYAKKIAEIWMETGTKKQRNAYHQAGIKTLIGATALNIHRTSYIEYRNRLLKKL